MSSVPRYVPHYTVKDYELWEGDWELWQGIPVAMTPSPFGRHQELSVKLAAELLRAVAEADFDATVLTEIDWIISEDTVVRPDVLVVCGGPPARHVESPPAIVAEILSPSTAGRDRGEKMQLYNDHGVQHYILIEPEDDSCDYFSLQNGQFVKPPSADNLVLAICEECRLAVDLNRVLN